MVHISIRKHTCPQGIVGKFSWSHVWLFPLRPSLLLQKISVRKEKIQYYICRFFWIFLQERPEFNILRRSGPFRRCFWFEPKGLVKCSQEAKLPTDIEYAGLNETEVFSGACKRKNAVVWMNFHFLSGFSNMLGQANTHDMIKLWGKLFSISIWDQSRTSFANIFESHTV